MIIIIITVYFLFISSAVRVWHSCLLTNMISSATLFPPGPHRTDPAIYMDTQDVRPNNSHYMNSITHVCLAWLLMGAVKQTLISQCVRTVNDQHWGQLGCNSLSTATSLPMQTVILMLTLYMWKLKSCSSTAPINNIDFYMFTRSVTSALNLWIPKTHDNVWFTTLFSQENMTLIAFEGYSRDLASEGK